MSRYQATFEQLAAKKQGAFRTRYRRKTPKRRLIYHFFTWIYWRFISPFNPLCISNDSLNGIFLYQTISG